MAPLVGLIGLIGLASLVTYVWSGRDASSDVTKIAASPVLSDEPEATGATTRVSARSCDSNTGERVMLVGDQNEQYRNTTFAAGSLFDAKDASWSGTDDDGDPIPWTVTLRNEGDGRGSCWRGGVIHGSWDDRADEITWEDPYHHAGGMTIDVPDFVVEDLTIDGHGDGIRTVADGSNSTIRGVRLSDIHDDCIENDYLHTIVVEDSLLDGCYSGFSARPHDSVTGDGSTNNFLVHNVLIRLEPQPTVFRGPSPGHGEFFKWDADGRSPTLSIHDTILRADQDANHGTLGIPDRVAIESCSGNTMVWLGDGPFPGRLPPCFTVTTDRTVWDEAVARWHRTHE